MTNHTAQRCALLLLMCAVTACDKEQPAQSSLIMYKNGEAIECVTEYQGREFRFKPDEYGMCNFPIKVKP